MRAIANFFKSIFSGRGQTPAPVFEAPGKSRAQGQQEFEAAIERLQLKQAALQELSASLEITFLQVGSGLVKLTEGSTRLLTQCEALRKLQTDTQDTEGVLKPVMRLLNVPLEFLTQCGGSLLATTKQLRHAVGQLVGLIASSTSVQQTMAPLAFIQVLFRVESAHLTDERQQMFAALTDDIARLRTKLLDTFGKSLETLATSHRAMEQRIKQLEEILNAHGQATQARCSQVEQTLAALQAELEQNQSRDTGLGNVSRSISNQVGQIVMSLQSQDIIAQRLAHVLEALSQLHVRHSAARAGNSTRLAEFYLYASQVAKLQAGQLQGIRAEAAQAEQTIQNGLASILVSISEMEKSCVAVAATGEPGAGNHAEQLTVLIETLLEPLASTQERTTLVCDLVGTLGGQASGITGVMRELASDIWLSGLNAEVQSAQIVQGTGLEVLSARTSSIARETRDVATQVGAEVNVLAADLEAILAQLNEVRNQASAHHQALATQGTQQRRHLDELHEQTERGLIEIGTIAANVRQIAFGVQGTVRFQGIVADTILETTAILETLGARAGELASKYGCTSLPEALAQELKGKYTMASEVATYEHALSSSRASLATPPAPAAACVELFDDFSAAPSEPVATGKELPEPASATRQHLSVSARELANSLGNNVELF